MFLDLVPEDLRVRDVLGRENQGKRKGTGARGQTEPGTQIFTENR